MNNKPNQYLPPNPMDILHSVEKVFALPDDAKVISVVVVVEDGETVESSTLIDANSIQYALRAIKNVLEAASRGETKLQSFRKSEVISYVTH